MKSRGDAINRARRYRLQKIVAGRKVVREVRLSHPRPVGHPYLRQVSKTRLGKDGERIQLRSRTGKDLTRTYQPVATAASRLRTAQAVLDGEIVAIDASGRPSFQALQHRAAHRGHTIVFYAFDLLHEDGTPVNPRNWL